MSERYTIATTSGYPCGAPAGGSNFQVETAVYDTHQEHRVVSTFVREIGGKATLNGQRKVVWKMAKEVAAELNRLDAA